MSAEALHPKLCSTSGDTSPGSSSPGNTSPGEASRQEHKRYLVSRCMFSPENQHACSIVFLHGWGTNSACWKPLIEHLQNCQRPLFSIDLPGFGDNSDALDTSLSAEESVAQTVKQIAESLPEKCVLVGWSLGGMLATQVAYLVPRQVESLITIASNATFAVRDDWPQACSETVFKQFLAGFKRDSDATFARFLMLQAKGDEQRKVVQRQLQECQAAPPAENHKAWWLSLQQLKVLDNRDVLSQVKQPCLQMFGDNDALVPLEVSAHIKGGQNALSRKAVVSDCGHAPHISKPREVAEHITEFLAQVAYRRKKVDIAQSFSKAATSYDRMADLQQQVASSLLDLLNTYRLKLKPLSSGSSGSSEQLVDLGCGTGFCASRLTSSYKRVIALDIAPGMLQEVSKRSPYVSRLCADLESLPLADAVADDLISSLSVQWCDNLALMLNEAYRVLKPGGCLFLSTLLPGTLQELQSSWEEVDQYVHVNNFLTAEDILTLAKNANFTCDYQQQTQEVRWFDKVMDLMRSLKGIGAHNINAGQNRGLTTRSKLAALQQAYEHFRSDKGLPASYQVMYLVLRKHGDSCEGKANG